MSDSLEIIDFDNQIEDIQDEVVPYRFLISSYGADYTVDSLCRRIESRAIFVPPFQRKFVWNINQSSKFIESLILGLPVPGIFLSKESGHTNRMLIIDGQQRLLTLFSFYNGMFKDRPFRLQGVIKEIEGKTYNDLRIEDKRRLDDSIIHATVVKQDEPSDDESSIYLIFERLNQGGKPLTPQEIRACIYYGSFNELLNELVRNLTWRKIFGKYNERLKEEELILRFFALMNERENYQKPLKSFLNTFMATNRNFEKYDKNELEKEFNNTMKFLGTAVPKKKVFRVTNAINAAIFDAIMVGTACRLRKGSILDPIAFFKAYNELLGMPEFISYAKANTSDEKPLNDRIDMAIAKFDTIS